MSQSGVLISGPVKGFKAFNDDFTCRDFQFELDKTYELPEGQVPVLCSRGFHFCTMPLDCNNYYNGNNSRHAEVEAWDVIHDNDKSVARKIHIVREITKDEWNNL